MTKTFWQKAANFALSVIKTFKVELPFKTLIFFKLFLWTLVWIRDNTDEKLLARGWKNFLCPQFIKDNWIFFQKNTSFPSKCGSAQVEVHFDSLVKVPLPKLRNFIEQLKYFGSKPKKDRKTDFCFAKIIFLTSGNVECQFYKPAEEFLSKAWKKSINVRIDKKHNFFEMKTISPLCFCLHVEDVFTTPPKMFRQKAEMTCINVRFW